MNKFNFDEKVVRRGTNSIKWDEPKEDGVLPCGWLIWILRLHLASLKP